jgi:hypothetical protein
MAYSSIMSLLDRLSVRSISRGGTGTIFGVLGTLILIILLLAIYIPPTQKYS